MNAYEKWKARRDEAYGESEADLAAVCRRAVARAAGEQHWRASRCAACLKRVLRARGPLMAMGVDETIFNNNALT